MAYPSLIRLLQPLGTLSPMGVLWASMGSAPAYEIFTGCAEVAGGLLLIPRTATLGAASRASVSCPPPAPASLRHDASRRCQSS
jgi:hypothetical protein